MSKQRVKSLRKNYDLTRAKIENRLCGEKQNPRAMVIKGIVLQLQVSAASSEEAFDWNLSFGLRIDVRNAATSGMDRSGPTSHIEIIRAVN